MARIALGVLLAACALRADVTLGSTRDEPLLCSEHRCQSSAECPAGCTMCDTVDHVCVP